MASIPPRKKLPKSVRKQRICMSLSCYTANVFSKTDAIITDTKVDSILKPPPQGLEALLCQKCCWATCKKTLTFRLLSLATPCWFVLKF